LATDRACLRQLRIHGQLLLDDFGEDRIGLQLRCA
jgi:hypothetical protein